MTEYSPAYCDLTRKLAHFYNFNFLIADTYMKLGTRIPSSMCGQTAFDPCLAYTMFLVILKTWSTGISGPETP